jgi:methylmalonyl-CoA mutase
MIAALRARNASHIVVVCGGVVPRGDHEFLLSNGVAAVFGPGTPVTSAARAVLDLLEGKLRNR